MKIIGIVQARMGSSRLPGKMLLDINGKPTIARVMERVQMVQGLDGVCLATTIAVHDNQLADWAMGNDVNCYRGDEEDVLDRYYQAALVYKADVVVRITGDCPLIDPGVVDRVISLFREGGFDYTSNIHPPTFPDGLDVEVFRLASLKKAWSEAKLKSEREHVTPYIWKNPGLFEMKNLANYTDLSSLRWTLDTAEDLELIRLIVTELDKSGHHWGMQEVIDVVNKNPGWLSINNRYDRNEGYTKSLKSDKTN